jgi:hypothetical protein
MGKGTWGGGVLRESIRCQEFESELCDLEQDASYRLCYMYILGTGHVRRARERLFF